MKIYFSHSIRGIYGDKATNVQMEANCKVASEIADQIRDAFPNYTRPDIYVPGEHDEFIEIAYKKGFLTEKQILDTDCIIIDRCDAVIVHVPKGDTLQGGRLVEYEHAIKTNTPCEIFADVENIIKWITDLILNA